MKVSRIGYVVSGVNGELGIGRLHLFWISQMKPTSSLATATIHLFSSLRLILSLMYFLLSLFCILQESSLISLEAPSCRVVSADPILGALRKCWAH